MAEPGRTVRVTGLPTDIEEERLKDKLSIHFLRSRNGGGEIDSVIVVKTKPVSALITFQDSGVAQRVIQHSRHILEVDGKQYRLTATQHRESLDPDQVILSLSAKVNYYQLPGGIMAMTSLYESHPEVQIAYSATDKLCTLSGSYSKVQAALTQLLGQHKGQESANKEDSDETASSGSQSVRTSQKYHARVSEDKSRKPNKEKEQREKNHTGRISAEYNPGSKRDLTPGGYGWGDRVNTDGAALRPLPSSVEDFTLIVDADMFQYLQKHCREEYQHILSKYNVDVLDETSQGLTTLCLQVAETTVTEEVQQQECLKLAREAIRLLYQENERKICQAQLSKSILSPRGRWAMESLSVKLPKVLLNEDEKNIYIIGSSSDVSEAKHFLLLGYDEQGDKREDVVSRSRYPLYDSGLTSSHAHEERVPFSMTSAVGSLDVEVENRVDGARKYKLAARFKDSGLATLGPRLPTDFTFRTNSSPSRQAHVWPLLGYDSPSETAGISVEQLSRSVNQNTGGDILFTRRYASPPSTSMHTKTFLKKEMDTRPKNLISPFSTTHSSLSGSAVLPPVGSGSTLKRANSFSGTPQQKAQVVGLEDSGKSTVRARGRSSSFSSQTGKEKQEVHTAEISVSQVMWHHIKDAYRTRVENFTSDLQMKESSLEGGKDLTVTLRGADLSKLKLCHQSLQRLVDSVSADFSINLLRFSELGVVDAADETLQACCSEVQSRFKKVTIHKMENALYLVGPNQLCSQVSATLREVFKGEPGQNHLSNSPMDYSPSSLHINVDQTTGVSSSIKSQVIPGSQSGKAGGNSVSQEWKTTYSSDFGEKEVVNGSISQSSVKKDHAMEKMETSGEKIKPFVKLSRNVMSPVNVATSAAIKKDGTTHAVQADSSGQRHAAIENHPEKPRLGQGGPVCCVCEKNGTTVTNTKCGLIMCPECLESIDLKCRACDELHQPLPGIHGDMKTSRLDMTIPGHNKNSVIKISYRIPDGIQGDNHPSPGKPFQGKLFEAYLPECADANKLLPRLEKAFRQGLTFTVTERGADAMVNWDCIPHKTSLHGGKAEKGYPDPSYLMRLSAVLSKHGIE